MNVGLNMNAQDVQVPERGERWDPQGRCTATLDDNEANHAEVGELELVEESGIDYEEKATGSRELAEGTSHRRACIPAPQRIKICKITVGLLDDDNVIILHKLVKDLERWSSH